MESAGHGSSSSTRAHTRTTEADAMASENLKTTGKIEKENFDK
jgi:hypothetical protein